MPLSIEIGELDYSTTIVILLIGSLGNVHYRFISGLLKAGITKTEAKFLAEYCSTSVVIGSFQIWKSRCNKLDSIV